MINATTITDMDQLILVKQGFRIKFQNLMTNVLKICLKKEEEMLACVITAYYEVIVELEMVIRALSEDNYKWLQFLWAFDKNFIGPRAKEDSVLFTYDKLFEFIFKQYVESRFMAEKKINEVMEWKVVSNDNILIALLYHNLDDIAI